MSGLGPEAKSLFGAARRELGPSEHDRVRVGRALGSRLGAAVLASSTLAAAGNSTAAGAAKGVKLALPVVMKWLGATVLVSASMASGYLLFRQPTPTTSAIALPTASSRAGVASSPPSLPARAPTPPAPLAGPTLIEPLKARSAGVPPATSPEQPAISPPPNARVGEEAALMRRAHEALRAGDPNRALAMLREHATRFPAGILAEERSARLVSTLCQLGRRGEAEREARRFLRDRPGSPLASSVRASCALSPTATEKR